MTLYKITNIYIYAFIYDKLNKQKKGPELPISDTILYLIVSPKKYVCSDDFQISDFQIARVRGPA